MLRRDQRVSYFSHVSKVFADHESILFREELYTDVRLNDILCERYQVHMGEWGRKVLKRHDKVLTASSDIGMCFFPTKEMPRRGRAITDY